MREAEIEMREAGQFHSLSFCVFARRGSQPGKKKKLTRGGGWRRENLGTRGEKKGDRHSGEIRVSRAEENKTEEQGARNGAFVSLHPIDLHLVLA